jgi:predicted Zn-dependent peptidase
MTSTVPSKSALHTPTVRQLPNGLTVIAERIPVEAVNLSLWTNFGSALEPDPINGMAHFLEHMVFKGTEQLQVGEFERLVEEQGAIANAATSQDYTHFYITTAPKDFANLAPLQMEVVLNPSIPEDAFERERSVVLEEIRRSEDNPRRRVFQRSMELAFDRLPYRRPVLGSVDAVASLSATQMREFHATWYRPQSVTAVVVGNLDPEDAIATIAAGCDRLENRANWTTDVPLPDPSDPGCDGESRFTDIIRRECEDENLQQARLNLIWRVPGLNQLDRTYALDVLAAILGQGRTSRLIRDLREDRGLVTRISAYNMTYRWQGLFCISAQLPEENLEPVEIAIADRVRALHAEPVRESEIDRIRTRVANRFIFGSETPRDRANLYGYYYSMMNDLAPALDYPRRIQSLDRPTLQHAAQQYLSPDAYGTLIVRPRRR